MMEKETINTDIGYIKLYKNTKGYNWEIKMHENKENESYKKLIDNINEIDEIMQSKFTSIE